jgi:hypothetical protein
LKKPRFDVRTQEAFEERKRGRDNEIRVLATLRRPDAALPKWIVRFRAANLHEDYFEHTDIVVETSDVGSIRVQVKSSLANAERFRERYPDLIEDMALVVANSAVDHDILRERILTALGTIRGRRLKKIKGERIISSVALKKRLEDIIDVLPSAPLPSWIISIQKASPYQPCEDARDFRVDMRMVGVVHLRIFLNKVAQQKGFAHSFFSPELLFVSIIARNKDHRTNLMDRVLGALSALRPKNQKQHPA